MPSRNTGQTGLRSFLNLPRQMLDGLTLSGQFALVGGLLMAVSAIAAGYFVSGIVSRTAIDRTATSTALFVESLISSYAQGLDTGDLLPTERARQIDEIVSAPPFKSRFPHLDIWTPNGKIAYSTTPEIIGRKFAPPSGLTSALGGIVAARFTDLSAGEHISRGFRNQFLEIYSPIRDSRTGNIIAVAEIHEISQPLRNELARTEAAVWIGVIGATTLIMLGLFSIVFRGTRLIEAQQAELRTRIDHIAKISEQNRELRERVQGAAGRLSESVEGALRRIGADLHDGPAQLIGFALMRLDHVKLAPSVEKRERELNDLGGVLKEAMDNIRSVSRDLLLPELQTLPMNDVISRAVRIHERRTQGSVTMSSELIGDEFSHAAKICVYRFVQEGLYNALRHARGEVPCVTAEWSDGQLTVTVSDSGGGTVSEAAEEASPGFGLIGLRERVESLGGIFTVSEDKGFKIEMSIVGTRMAEQ
jgi:signal transduction histidine kinase